MRRRSTQIFSLAFLDCICCGFGAIILLFVLTVDKQDKATHEARDKLRAAAASYVAQLADLQARKGELERGYNDAARLVLDVQKQQESFKGLLDDLEEKIQYEKKGHKALLSDLDELKRDIAARQKKPEQILNENVKPTPVGLPANSNYVAFVIDSSGSMRDPNSERIWPIVLEKFDDVLNAYPEIKGIQFLDADGRFIMGRQAEQAWLTDSPANREAIKQALFNYDIFSNSNPVPGIVRVLRTLYKADDPEMKLTIFILGDEFTGTADAVLRRLDELNPKGEDGKRRVVINAIGYPTAVKMGFSMGNTGVKYANLMREVCFQHGGAFIALQELEEN